MAYGEKVYWRIFHRTCSCSINQPKESTGLVNLPTFQLHLP